MCLVKIKRLDFRHYPFLHVQETFLGGGCIHMQEKEEEETKIVKMLLKECYDCSIENLGSHAKVIVVHFHPILYVHHGINLFQASQPPSVKGWNTPSNYVATIQQGWNKVPLTMQMHIYIGIHRRGGCSDPQNSLLTCSPHPHLHPPQEVFLPFSAQCQANYLSC